MRGQFGHRNTDIQGIKLCKDRDRDWSEVSVSQAAKRIADNHQKTGKDSSLEPSVGTWAHQHFDF